MSDKSRVTQAVSPVFLSRAAMPAFLPPGVQMTLSPTISGLSAMPHVIFRPSNRSKALTAQTRFPSVVKQTTLQLPLITYTRSSSTVGVERALS